MSACELCSSKIKAEVGSRVQCLTRCRVFCQVVFESAEKKFSLREVECREICSHPECPVVYFEGVLLKLVKP